MSIMPLSEFSGEKNESREDRVMRWREGYYRQESCIATIKAQRDELLEALKAIVEGGGGSCENTFHAVNIEIARAAIAKIEGAKV